MDGYDYFLIYGILAQQVDKQSHIAYVDNCKKKFLNLHIHDTNLNSFSFYCEIGITSPIYTHDVFSHMLVKLCTSLGIPWIMGKCFSN
jgi:hypothetical protein